MLSSGEVHWLCCTDTNNLPYFIEVSVFSGGGTEYFSGKIFQQYTIIPIAELGVILVDASMNYEGDPWPHKSY